ncbi:MAG: L-seryl-tRNA(Sec) selenium transferase [Lachnospirales bacterium]
MSLKNLPKTDIFLESTELAPYFKKFTYQRILTEIRKSIDNKRNILIKSSTEETKEEIYNELLNSIIKKLDSEEKNSLKTIINGTGILIHTNLGRSVLSEEVAEKVAKLSSSYTNLEYSLEEGKRGSRMSYVEKILCDITGAESALVVNNNASSVFLILNTLSQNKEVVLSRGELVEIGGSFRVSEIIENSGCILKEIGTTNKTHEKDYIKATTENTQMYLKVHPSNFKIQGFTEEVSVKDLVLLRDKINEDIIVVDDMGSGVLFDLSKLGLKKERLVQESLQDGADLVCFSGDKLLGGPQAGIILGKKKYIDQLKSNQMLRCLRVDKMCLVALIETLKYYISQDSILSLPLFNMATTNISDLEEKGKTILNGVHNEHLTLSLNSHKAMFGGGSLPEEFFDSIGIFIKSNSLTSQKIEKKLRDLDTPIITLINDDNVIINLSTIFQKDLQYIIDTLNNF